PGNGTIAGATNGQSVSVAAGALCNSNFTLTVTFSNTNGCSSTCSQNFLVNDTTPPTITAIPPGGNLGCNPSNPPTDASVAAQVQATDNCQVAVTNVTHSDSTSGCTLIRTFTVVVSDACNTATTNTVVYSWTVDTDKPVFTGCPTAAIGLGCNPTLPTCATVQQLRI